MTPFIHRIHSYSLDPCCIPEKVLLSVLYEASFNSSKWLPYILCIVIDAIVTFVLKQYEMFLHCSVCAYVRGKDLQFLWFSRQSVIENI